MPSNVVSCQSSAVHYEQADIQGIDEVQRVIMENHVMPINIIYYGGATLAVSSMILNVRPQYFICNTSHGLWGTISGHGSEVFQDLSAFKAAGIKVVGYITGGYEGRQSGGEIDSKWYTLAMNRILIRDMAKVDRVDGVFIDECSSFPDENGKAYLKELTSLAHSYGLITWCNMGTDNFDPWFFTGGGFDMAHSTEQWHDQILSNVQLDWGCRTGVSGFSSEYTLEDAFHMTVNAWRKGLAYAYITNDSVGYSSLPSWIDKYVDLLKQYKLSSERHQPPFEKVKHHWLRGEWSGIAMPWFRRRHKSCPRSSDRKMQGIWVSVHKEGISP